MCLPVTSNSPLGGNGGKSTIFVPSTMSYHQNRLFLRDNFTGNVSVGNGPMEATAQKGGFVASVSVAP